MSGNLEYTNKLILLPLLENAFFHQRLALEVLKYVLLFLHSAVHSWLATVVDGNELGPVYPFQLKEFRCEEP